MSVTLLRLAADLELSLAAAVTVGQTTATLSSAADSDGVALPSGKYGFTVDGDNSAKEYIVCDLVGTALTNVVNITRQGATTVAPGFANYHRVGATVTITDWAILSRMLKNLDGTTGFDSGTALKYDGQPGLSDPTAIPTVQYVLDTVNGGPVSLNATVVAGDAGENVADGDWVYYDVSDGEWYKTDADITAKCLGVQIGKARGAGTNGNPITGGIFIAGLETVGTYVAATTYYLSNTAGALATSAGTNSVVVGVGDANGDLLLRKLTPSQTDAAQGGSTFGTPSGGNKFITQDYNASATGVPTVQKYLPVSLGSTTTRFDVTNPAGTTFRYTYDGTGTDPGITALTVPTGSRVNIYAVGSFSAGNLGTFVVTGSGANYFEVTNASGVAENDKTLARGHLFVLQTTTTWSKPAGLKYVVIELVGGGGGGGGTTTVDDGAGGGGAGGYSRKLVAAATLGATETVTVGIPGTGGVPTGGAGGTGGTTSFGAHCSATGGSGGASSREGGLPGVGSSGDLNLSGQAGQNTVSDADITSPMGGTGGTSHFGGGGLGGDGPDGVTTGIGGNSGQYGGGGGGGASDAGADIEGGTGGAGACIVTEYYS